jgi:hypothetical protein
VLPLAYEVATAPDLFPGHALSFTEVALDDVGVRIEYVIAPALSKRAQSMAWVGYARDDLGNDYQHHGGAYGTARDGARTEGVLTLPYPVDEAKALRVRLWPGGDPAGFDDDRSPAYELIVGLEL